MQVRQTPLRQELGRLTPASKQLSNMLSPGCSSHCSPAGKIVKRIVILLPFSVLGLSLMSRHNCTRVGFSSS